MDKQNLVIFKQDSLYEIFSELEENLNFGIFKVSSEKNLDDKLDNLSNYLIITQKELNGKNNQFIFNKAPIKLSKLIEKINIQLLNNLGQLVMEKLSKDAYTPISVSELNSGTYIVKLTVENTTIYKKVMIY